MWLAAAVDPLDPARRAVEAIDRLYGLAHGRLKERVARGGSLDAAALDRDQLAAHALAYVATDLAACRQMLAWAASHPTNEARAVAQVFVAEVARSLRSVVWFGATETYGDAELHVTTAQIEVSVWRPS